MSQGGFTSGSGSPALDCRAVSERPRFPCHCPHTGAPDGALRRRELPPLLPFPRAAGCAEIRSSAAGSGSRPRPLTDASQCELAFGLSRRMRPAARLRGALPARDGLAPRRRPPPARASFRCTEEPGFEPHLGSSAGSGGPARCKSPTIFRNAPLAKLFCNVPC